MPATLELFLSYQILPIIGGMYLIAFIIVIVGFKYAGVKRRKDVIMRSGLMHGTYIFLSHALGLMLYSTVLLCIHAYGLRFDYVHNVTLTIISMLCAVVIYMMLTKYLWLRIALSKKEANRLILYALVFVTPWYFILNFL